MSDIQNPDLSIVKQEIQVKEECIESTAAPIKYEIDIEENHLSVKKDPLRNNDDQQTPEEPYFEGFTETKTDPNTKEIIPECLIKTETDSVSDEILLNPRVSLQDCWPVLRQCGRFCFECGVLFTSIDSLTDHNIIKDNVDINYKGYTKNNEDPEKPYKCNLCEYRTGRVYCVKVHMKKHTGEKPFKCNHCDFCAKSKQTLKEHVQRLHTLSLEKPFKCPLCDYRAARSNNIKSHMNVHNKDATFSCNLCDYKTARKNELKVHVIRHHTKEKAYECSMCEFKAFQQHALNSHMMTHKKPKEKPFKCKLCEYTCSFKGSLKMHEKTHTNEKPYTCNMCEYKAVRNDHLKKHMVTHTQEKPFKCNMCEHRCSQKANLNAHIRKWHKGEPYSCNLCEFKCLTNEGLNKHVEQMHKETLTLRENIEIHIKNEDNLTD